MRSYICGQTTVPIHIRGVDRKGGSFRTIRPFFQVQNNRIRDHAEDTNYELVSNNFRVLSKCNEFDTKKKHKVCKYIK